MNGTAMGPQPHESRVTEIIVSNVVFILFASVFVFARIFTRLFIQRMWTTDDNFLCLSWLFYLGYVVTSSVQTRHGAGLHKVDVSPDFLIPFLQTTYWCLLFYVLSQGTVKLSIALLYLRVLSWQDQARRLIYAVIAFISITHLLGALLFAFGCTPVSKAWNPHTHGKCVRLTPGIIAYSIVSVLSDFSLIMIVLPRVISLQTSRLQKIGVLLVVNLGWVAIVASILRSIKVVALQGDPDYTWNVLDYIVWYGIDSTIGLTCAAASTLKPLLRKLLGTWWANLSRQHSKNQQTTLYWENQAVETEEKQPERSNENNLENGIEMEQCSAVGGSELAQLNRSCIP